MTGELALRVALTFALVYMFLLALVIGQGSQDWHGANQVAGLEPEWFAWAILLLAIASLVSIGSLWGGLDSSEPTGPAQRVILAFVAILLVTSVVMVFPAARAASREYEGKLVLSFPGSWLGWVALPLATNAIALLAFVLWPRIRRPPR